MIWGHSSIPNHVYFGYEYNQAYDDIYIKEIIIKKEKKDLIFSSHSNKEKVYISVINKGKQILVFFWGYIPSQFFRFILGNSQVVNICLIVKIIK